MRRLGVLLALAACAEPPARTTQDIIGGTADYGHPEVVLITWPSHLCTGTLISTKIVLTAAHCVTPVEGGPPETPTNVFFGRVRGSAGTTLAAAAAFYEPAFSGFNDDIGLVVLATRSDVVPARVNFAPLTTAAVGQPIKLVGFGRRSVTDASLFGEKRVITVDVTGVDDQVVVYERSVCSGDSGGPGFMTLDDGETYVVGVTSYGDFCMTYGASQRTDTHAEWLQGLLATYDPPSCEKDARCVDGCPAVDPDCPCSSTDGFCSVLCEDTDSDTDCPHGCGSDGACVSGPDCPRPDPDCGDPCGGEGHCLEECPARDPDCPTPLALGVSCGRDFDCGVAACWESVCTARCDATDCDDGFACEPHGGAKLCLPAPPSGCSVGGGGGGALLVLLVLALRRRALWLAVLCGVAHAEPAHLARGTAAFQDKRYQAAAAAFREAELGSPNDAEAPYRLGVALVAAGERDAAAAAWERVLIIDPGHERAQRNLDLLRARPGSPSDDAARVSRAREMLGRARYVSARALIDEVAAPGADALLVRGEARLALGEEGADADMAAALVVGARPALRGMADAAAAAGDVERARRLYDLYAARFAGEPDARAVRAWLRAPPSPLAPAPRGED